VHAEKACARARGVRAQDLCFMMFFGFGKPKNPSGRILSVLAKISC
jgi:hypothetical protein